MKTAEDVIRDMQQQVDAMPEALRKKPIVRCACGQHTYSWEGVVEAMKDPNNTDGQALIAAAIAVDEAEADLS